MINFKSHYYFFVYSFLNHVFFIQVKQIMEEAVTRKFVHEESSSITSLCGKYLYMYVFL